MPVSVKICGLRDAASVAAAFQNGAGYVGFVFYPPSKRFVTVQEATTLAVPIPASVKRVGLFVDASDEDIRDAAQKVPLDMIQLHGNETPERVTAIRALAGRPVMKALPIASENDLKALPAYEAVADWLLFDARAEDGVSGGTGKSFDWSLLQGRVFNKPWMLAGGLSSTNLAEAVRITGAHVVDVSSGVEDSGQKNPDKIKEFLALAGRLP